MLQTLLWFRSWVQQQRFALQLQMQNSETKVGLWNVLTACCYSVCVSSHHKKGGYGRDSSDSFLLFYYFFLLCASTKTFDKRKKTKIKVQALTGFSYYFETRCFSSADEGCHRELIESSWQVHKLHPDQKEIQILHNEYGDCKAKKISKYQILWYRWFITCEMNKEAVDRDCADD